LIFEFEVKETHAVRIVFFCLLVNFIELNRVAHELELSRIRTKKKFVTNLS